MFGYCWTWKSTGVYLALSLQQKGGVDSKEVAVVNLHIKVPISVMPYNMMHIIHGMQEVNDVK